MGELAPRFWKQNIINKQLKTYNETRFVSFKSSTTYKYCKEHTPQTFELHAFVIHIRKLGEVAKARRTRHPLIISLTFLNISLKVAALSKC